MPGMGLPQWFAAGANQPSVLLREFVKSQMVLTHLQVCCSCSNIYIYIYLTLNVFRSVRVCNYFCNSHMMRGVCGCVYVCVDIAVAF